MSITTPVLILSVLASIVITPSLELKTIGPDKTNPLFNIEISKELPIKQLGQTNFSIASTANISVPQAYSVPADEAKAYIYQHESGNNPGAINASSGACGLGQALPCSKMPCSLDDYACQDNYFTQYMEQRYGTWDNAYNWWISHKWW